MLRYKIAKNTVLSAISEGSNLFLFLVAIFAARFLGDYLFGVFSFALAFVGLFQILPDFGIGYANTIEVARDKTKAKDYFCNSLGLQILLGLITFGIIYIIINLTEKSSTTRLTVYILSGAMLLKSFKTTFRWIFKSLERFDYEALTLTIERSLTFALCILALVLGKSLVAFVCVFMGARLIDLVLTITITGRKFFIPIPKINIKLWLDFIKRGFPFVIVGAMITIFFQIDAVMLSFMRNPQEVGWYSASYKLIEMLTAIPRVIAYALLPTLSILHISSTSTITPICRKASKYLFIIALPICAYIFFRAPEIINLIFGSKYQKSIISLQVLILSTIFMFQSTLGETVLASINRWKLVVYAASISVIANIVLNLILIPIYGYIGAGIATIITEFLYFYFIYRFLARAGHSIGIFKILFRPLLATLILVTTLYLTRSLGFITVIFLSGIIYLAGIILTGCLDKDELQLLKSFPKKLFHA